MLLFCKAPWWQERRGFEYIGWKTYSFTKIFTKIYSYLREILENIELKYLVYLKADFDVCDTFYTSCLITSKKSFKIWLGCWKTKKRKYSLIKTPFFDFCSSGGNKRTLSENVEDKKKRLQKWSRKYQRTIIWPYAVTQL